MFRAEIKTEVDGSEIVQILRKLADKIEKGDRSGKIYDCEGIKIGEFKFYKEKLLFEKSWRLRF